MKREVPPVSARPLRRVVALVALVTLSGGVSCVEPTRREERWTSRGLPAAAEVQARTARDADALLAEVRGVVDEAQARLAPDDPESDLVRLEARAVDDYVEVEDRDLYRCLLLALDYARAADGAIDPTIGAVSRLYVDEERGARLPRPGEIEVALASVDWRRVAVAEEAHSIWLPDPAMRLDLGGVSEGFALDLAARAFARPGAVAGLLRLGPVWRAWGRPPGQEAWSVAVEDPRDPPREALSITLRGRSVALSGHAPPTSAGLGARPILDPHTGRPAASGMLLALAVADSAADAEAMSRSFFVLGRSRAADLLARSRRVEAAFLVEGEEHPVLLASGALRGRITLGAELAAEVANDVRFVLPPLEPVPGPE